MTLTITPQVQSLLTQGAHAIDPDIDLAPPAAASAAREPIPSTAADAVDAIDPLGNPIRLSRQQFSGLTRKGYTLAPDAREGDLGEAALVGGYQVANQAAFGLLGSYLDHSQTPDEKVIWEAAKDRHPIANALGAASGFGASLVVGGPLFKLASKAGLAAHAAVLGTEAAADVVRSADAASAVVDAARGLTPEAEAASAVGQGTLGPQVAEDTVKAAGKALEAQHGAIAKEAMEAAHDAALEHLADKLGAIAGPSATPDAVAAALSKVDIARTTEVAADVAARSAPSLARKALAKAVQYGVEGAILSAPQSLADAALNDWRGAGEALLAGVGANVGLGLAGEAASAGASKLAELAGEHVPDLSSLGDRMALRSVGINKGIAKKLSDDRKEALADWLHTSGAMGGARDRDELADLVEQKHGEAGERVSSSLKELDAAHLEAGRPHVIDGAAFKQQMTDALQPHLDDRFGVSAPEQAEAQKWVKAVEALPEKMDLSDLQALKSKLGKLTSFDRKDLGVTEGLKAVRRDAYGAVQRFQEQEADAVAGAIGKPEVAAAWKQSKKDFGSATDAMKGIQDYRDQQSGNRLMSLTDNMFMAGSSGAGTRAIAGALLGHPVLGAVAGLSSIVGKAGKLMAKKWAANQGLILGSKFLRDALTSPETGAMGITLASRTKDALDAGIQGLGKALSAGRQSAVAGDPLARFLGPPARGKTAQQKMKMAQDILASPHDPLTASGPIMPGAPNAAKAYGDAVKVAMAYLSTKVPKSPPKEPFGPEPPNPTPEEALAFQQTLGIFNDPLSAISHVANGTLSKAQVDALKAMYPDTYGKMCTELLRVGASSSAPKLDTDQQFRVALLLGHPIDRTQQNPAAMAWPVAPVAPPKDPQRSSGRQLKSTGPSQLTSFQKALDK